MLGATRNYSENGEKAAIGRVNTLKGRLSTSPPAPILKRELPLNLASENAQPLLCFSCGGEERNRSRTDLESAVVAFQYIGLYSGTNEPTAELPVQ
jgi:hypothetical protein